MSGIGYKVAMHNETDAMNVDDLKQTLIQRRAELSERLERVARHTRHRDEPLPQDFAEQAVELGNGETLVALDRKISQELAQIDHALHRIKVDQYFDCETCGGPIGEQRLIALPHTTLCIRCANGSSDRSILRTAH